MTFQVYKYLRWHYKIRDSEQSCKMSAGLCRHLWRSLHRVRHRGRRRSGSLRRQEQEVHRSHKDQHVHHESGLQRLLSGENARQPFVLSVTHGCDFISWLRFIVYLRARVQHVTKQTSVWCALKMAAVHRCVLTVSLFYRYDNAAV